jgi:hypothetical protein
MKRWGTPALAALALALIGLAGWWSARPSFPKTRHLGLTTEQWFAKAVASDPSSPPPAVLQRMAILNGQQPPPPVVFAVTMGSRFKLSPMSRGYPDLSPDWRDACQALHTNAMPYLLWVVERTGGPAESAYAWFYDHARASWRTTWRIPYDKLSQKRGLALSALTRFRHLLTTPMVEPTLRTLAARGDTDDMLYLADVFRLRDAGMARFLAVQMPSLSTAQQQRALQILEESGANSWPALGAVTNALHSVDDEVRYLAAKVLVGMGTNGTAALPALEAARSDPSVIVRNAAVRAIRSIHGEPLEEGPGVTGERPSR